jgi:hypothetical protein
LDMKLQETSQAIRAARSNNHQFLLISFFSPAYPLIRCMLC